MRRRRPPGDVAAASSAEAKGIPLSGIVDCGASAAPEAARLLTWRAAKLIDAGKNSLKERAHPSIAKCYATDAAMKITTDAVQLLGGAGYVREYRVEGLMRDAKMLQIVEGTNQIQRSLIARSMR